MIDLVGSTRLQPKEKLLQSKKVMKTVMSNIQQEHCWLWMAWAPKLEQVLLRTAKYAEWMGIDNIVLKKKWDELINKGTGVWERIVGGVAIEGEALDEGEEAEVHLYGDVGNGPEDLMIDGDDL